MKMSVFLDTVILPQKGNNLKEGKNYVSKCWVFNIEKPNQSRCQMGTFLVNSGYIYLIDYYAAIKIITIKSICNTEKVYDI